MAKVTPGYWECPRCKSREIYFAKRTIGTVGTLVDLPQGVANPGIARNVEKDVALCHECRERANWIPEKIEYTEEEKQAKNKKSSLVWGWIFALLGTVLTYLGYQLAFVYDETPGYLLFGLSILGVAIYYFVKSNSIKDGTK